MGAHVSARLAPALTRIFVESVHAFYAERSGASVAKSGAVTVVQRTSSDPHLHTLFLDGTYHEQGASLVWEPLGHIQTREVGEVLAHAVRRIARHLRRHGAAAVDEHDEHDPEQNLAASAVSGRTPPAGPQWLRGLPPLAGSALGYDKPLCASLDGFTLHAATRAGAADTAGREALVRYVLRPPIAQKNVELLPDGLVRIALKRAYQDGTVAVEMDPLSLLSRLAASVPPPRHHVVKYGGVLAPASPWRARVAPARPTEPDAGASCEAATAPCQLEGVKTRAGTYRPWAELLRRTFGVDALACPRCGGRMKLVAMVTDRTNIARYLASIGEPDDVPARAPSRGPPYWKSIVLRRKAGHDEP